jgi:hypothetical protein
MFNPWARSEAVQDAGLRPPPWEIRTVALGGRRWGNVMGRWRVALGIPGRVSRPARLISWLVVAKVSGSPSGWPLLIYEGRLYMRGRLWEALDVFTREETSCH